MPDDDEIVLLSEIESRLKLAQVEKDEAEAQLATIEAAERAEKHVLSDSRNGVFRFTDRVDERTVGRLVKKLSRADRAEDDNPWTLILDTPGGSVTDGMHLFDELVAYSKRGGGNHYLTIKVRGMAASMGAVILQAADERVMGRESFLLLHEAHGHAWGSYGQMVDEMELITMMNRRTLNIFNTRSGRTHNFHRRDWWVEAEVALANKLVDRIG